MPFDNYVPLLVKRYLSDIPDGPRSLPLHGSDVESCILFVVSGASCVPLEQNAHLTQLYQPLLFTILISFGLAPSS